MKISDGRRAPTVAISGGENEYILCGPSGSGKSTLMDALEDALCMTCVCSITDRPKRSWDENNHVFVTSEQFDKMRPTLAVHEHYGFRYGVTEAQLDAFELAVFEPNGVRDILERYHGKPIKVIGLSCSPSVCERRMTTRGDSASDIQRRLEDDSALFNGFEALCDIVLNCDYDEHTVLASAVRYIVSCESGSSNENTAV